MQEILNAADSATYRLALQDYIIDNIDLNENEDFEGEQ